MKGSLAALLFASVLLPQLAALSQAPSGQENLRVDVRLVNVFVTVTNGSGRHIGGLTKDDFIVEEDGVIQDVAHFGQDDGIPVSVGILFDASGSMINKLKTAVNAVDRFIRMIHRDDDIFLMAFSARIDLKQDFTDNRDKLTRALRTIEANGGTSLYDALEQGLLKIKSGRQQKRAILLISDGEDTSSRAKFPQVLQHIREAELLVYPLGISPVTYASRSEHVPFNWPPLLGGGARRPVSVRRDSVDMNVLESLATESGGRAFLLTESVLGGGNQIEKVLGQIAEELRSQYTLGFYPKHPDDGKFHWLRVRSKNGLFVRARTGYTAGSPRSSAPLR
jgi:Ca-activated chloride channel homolog